MNASEMELKTFRRAFSGMEQGFKGTLDQLDEYLANTKKRKTI
jgi:hypothetical protein